jgi:plasmid maintenance system killer protein
MKTKLILFNLIVWCTILACSSVQNPAASTFNTKGSDAKAIQIADAVMKASGGRKAWNETEFIAWNFFGARHLIWNKKTGDVRIDIKKDNTAICMNIQTMQGNVKKNGVLLSGEERTKLLEKGKRIWINDSYWLVMPFKLKDDGVTLKYIKEDKAEDGKLCDVLQLSFEKVGVTPENKYYVFVDQSTHLVVQWQFFKTAADTTPDFTNMWLDYQPQGKILLSGNRGKEGGSLTEIAVDAAVDTTLLNEF